MGTNFKINNSIEINELDDELVIIIPQVDKMYYCNKLAKYIICSIRDGLNINQIIDLLFAKFDVDLNSLKSDISEIIDRLIDFQILISEEN